MSRVKAWRRPNEDNPSWRVVVAREASPQLDRLLELAGNYDMTAEEIEAQRQSWARQDKD